MGNRTRLELLQGLQFSHVEREPGRCPWGAFLSFPAGSCTICERGDIILLFLEGCGEGHTSLRV